MMLRSMFIPDLDGMAEYDVVTIEEVVNFVISGSFAYYAFVTGSKQLRGIS